MPGKPVLDIAIAAANEPGADACMAGLASLGAKSRGPHGDVRPRDASSATPSIAR